MKTDCSIFMLQIAGKYISSKSLISNCLGGGGGWGWGIPRTPLAWQGPLHLVIVLPGFHTLMHIMPAC